MTQDQSGMFGAAGTGDTSGYGGLVRQAVSFGSTERPYGSYFDEVADDLERAYPDFSDAITRVVVDRDVLFGQRFDSNSGSLYAHLLFLVTLMLRPKGLAGGRA